jgi:23S rRNA (cytosine1962-C5)-methyltransferase
MSNKSLQVLTPDGWRDYELLDTGAGRKLERFGRYVLARPESQALWSRTLADKEWARADAEYEFDERGKGHWRFRHALDDRWLMSYRHLKFWARCTPFRHTGVFPEQAALWDWLAERVHPQMQALNLFGYTGLASLVAARAGAQVTHVDASKPALAWAKENQEASSLNDKPVRWLQDDATKFVQRELRRGRKYDGLLLDPPAYGRGRDGETWRWNESLPPLLEACARLLSDEARFVVITAYAVDASALLLANLLGSLVRTRGGEISAGELALSESSSGKLLSQALFARWSRE